MTIADVNRDNAVTATLTLAYDNVDFATDGTLSITVLADGHISADDLPTVTIPITASAGVNLCGRTPKVRDAILDAISPPASDCTNVTTAELQSVMTIDLSGQQAIPMLGSSDFAGLSGLTLLNLNRNRLSSLPADIFAGLSSLTDLRLDRNQFATFDADIFAGLSMLGVLKLNATTVSRRAAVCRPVSLTTR